MTAGPTFSTVRHLSPASGRGKRVCDATTKPVRKRREAAA